ncbi:nuclear transport factor 2 family protein [Mycobacterium sp. 1081908.1]|uniref:nuclear transport factor 2 family protein n=1 Tax=Mycobacterium sp. 1081908.1 TaxID=1834066 RepID=UPI0009ECDE1B|nr:nuclear transport factor 2 family protein [Mycobacterium sp. 1081908.1]
MDLGDRAALSDLVHRYAAYVDDRQFDSVTMLFTETAELHVPAPPDALEPVHTHRGHEAIAAAVAAVAAVTRTEHAIVGEVYDEAARGGTAGGRVACVAHHWSPRGDEVVDVVWHLRYDDEYRLTDAGWRISRRALTVNAIETRPTRRLRPSDPRRDRLPEGYAQTHRDPQGTEFAE